MDQQTVRALLTSKRDELLSRVSKLNSDLNREEPYSADFAEQAVELENLDVLFELDREGREELTKINNALMRLDTGEYTICSSCGNTINTARLEAIPYTSLCIQCAEAEESAK
jgi:RNA polymerase-binding protein DksA